MTAPYLRSPGNQFLEAFGGAYQQGAQGFLGAQAREEAHQLELRRLAIDQNDRDRRFAFEQSDAERRNSQNERDYGDRQETTALERALQGIAPQSETNGADTVEDPVTHQQHPRWIGLTGTSFAQEWRRTPDYAAQTVKANESIQRNALGDALRSVHAPDGVIAAARTGTLPQDVATQYLNAEGVRGTQLAAALGTARAGAMYREPPAGQVIQVPSDPTNPNAPVRNMLLDTRTGRARPITDPAGQPLLGLPKGTAAPNATDRKDAALAGSAASNFGLVDSILAGPQAPSAFDLTLANHWYSRPFASSGAKRVQNAGGMATQDLGHLKAGARLPAPEFERAYNSFIPQVGDDAATLAAKAGARALAKRAAGTTAGGTPFMGSTPGADAATDPFKKFRGLIPPGGP